MKIHCKYMLDREKFIFCDKRPVYMLGGNPFCRKHYILICKHKIKYAHAAAEADIRFYKSALKDIGIDITTVDK